MDDVIVIILTLIIAVAGVMSQIKKKKQIPDNSNSTNNMPDSLWDLFQEEQGIKESVSNNEFDGYDRQQVKQPVVEEKEEVEINKPAYQFSPQQEGKSIFASKAPMKRNISKVDSRVKKDFSLKKAVIYSEILNRKYN